MLSSADVRELAQEQGLKLCSILSVARVEQELQVERERLIRWQENGYAAEMNFMKREPLADLSHFLPGVQSILVFSVPYSRERLPATPSFHGRIARYAWGRDYHLVLREKLDRLLHRIKSKYIGTCTGRVFTDAVPLLERALARIGGLGFIGKNSLLIRPGVGSFTFIAELLLDVELEEYVESHKGVGCGDCRRCIDVCPTGAIVKPFEVNAEICISYLTIEKRSPFSDSEEQAIGEWLFGCDLCQDYCPFNSAEGAIESEATFEIASGVGPFLSLKEVLSFRANADYKRRFAGSAILRAKREQLVRNAIFVAVNRGEIELSEDIILALREDSSPLVRDSARRGLIQLKDQAEGLDKIRLESALIQN